MRMLRPGTRIVLLFCAVLLADVCSALAAQDANPPPQPEAPAPPPPAAPPPPQDPQGVGGSQVSPASSKVFNPDMSVIGNFIGVAGDNPVETTPAFDLSEVELAFQAVVDPYSRADFFLSATPEGLQVEEAFLTFTTLPAGLLLKVGKMRAQFGKANTMHTHILPWTDRPLVTRNLVGGEDGISDVGASLSKLIPNDALYLEATGEIFSPRSDVFKSDERSKVVATARLRGYRDLTENTNIDVGTSFATGPTDDVGADLHKQLYGVDMTFRWRPLRRAIYRRFVGRTELIWSRQDLPVVAQPVAGTSPSDKNTAFGMYASGDYQFAQRWYAGGRYDFSGRTLDSAMHDNGVALTLAFWPSEFSQIRGEYRRTNYAQDIGADEFFIQFNFSIGAHGAHVF